MKNAAGAGFTLIEVTFALMLMTLGLFAIFHLFPSGLRASVDANAFTRQAMFAEDCFGAVRAKAAETNGWAVVFDQYGPVELSDGTPMDLNRDWSDGAFVYPDGQDAEEYLRCKVTVSQARHLAGTNTVLGKVKIETRYGRVGTMGETFYTEIYDYGM